MKCKITSGAEPCPNRRKFPFLFEVFFFFIPVFRNLISVESVLIRIRPKLEPLTMIEAKYGKDEKC